MSSFLTNPFMFSYILWNANPELFSFGQFTLRWNGLLLILAFLISRQILIYIYKKEGKPSRDVEILATYLIIASVLGARLGHVIFYRPDLWSKPLAIFFPFEFKPAFHFVGMTGFSSHGAALGILLGVWVYSRRKKPGQNYLPVLDRISILVAFTCIPILIGSFLNSEIPGKPTNSASGTVITSPVTKGLMNLPCCIMRNPNGKNPLDLVSARKDNRPTTGVVGHQSIILYLFFKQGTTRETVDEFIIGDVKTYLYDISDFVYEPGTEPIHFTNFQEISGEFVVRIQTIGIARYPVQLFESLSCFILFLFLFWYWYKHKTNLPSGRIFGLFMTLFWSLRFASEYLNEYHLSVAKGIGLSREQILCTPMIMIGIGALILSYRKSAKVLMC